MVNDAEIEAFELKCRKLEELIEFYSNKRDFYIALSLALVFYLFDFGCRNFEDHVANKATPLNEKQKSMFRRFLPLDEEGTSELLFEVEEAVLLLGDIKKAASSDYKILLEDAVGVFKKYSKDRRFIRNCNEGYSAIKEGFGST